ncbi:MAG: hypothetical protein ACXWPK_14320, partial [Isosphaeraceae bacterium]
NLDRHLALAILATNRLLNPSPDSVAGLPRGGVGRFHWRAAITRSSFQLQYFQVQGFPIRGHNS